MGEGNKESGDLIRKLREEMQLNRREFCDYYEIPYRTVQDWETGKRTMPDYVFRLLEYKMHQEQKNGMREKMLAAEETSGIQVMQITDYDEVYQLWQECEGIGLYAVDDSRKGMERFLQRNPTSCFVMRKDQRIVGTILSGNDGRRGYIYHLAVAPAYRREHIGFELVNAALQELQRQKIHKAALVVYVNNAEGNAFWQRMGFDIRKELGYYSRDIRVIEE